jgi:hypothetical protein
MREACLHTTVNAAGQDDGHFAVLSITTSLGNRAQGGSYGTVVHIGLLELNQCVDRNNNKKIDTASVGGLVAWCVLGGRAGVGSCIRAHVLEDVVARVRN